MIAQSAQKRRFSSRKVAQTFFSYAVLIFVTVLILVPVIWLVVTSLKVDSEYNTWPIKFFPKSAQWGNYAEVFDARHRILKYARNSLYLALTNTILTLLSSSMAGYAFSRFRNVPGQKRLFSIVIILLLIPSIITVIPQFIIYQRLGLTNTYWPWIIGGIGGSALFIFMFRQFFLSFPKELEDAAEVDGCNPFRIYWQIFLPNSKPVLATAFILGFNGVWSDWYTPVIYLSSENTTLAIKVASSFVNPQGHTVVTVTLAACVVYIVPLVVMFFLGQKHILRGVVTSGLKG
jgi:ABC-type glycerol-3-phosphate transport system permease component